MGKIAKALGINVKGTATISIECGSYHPGETVIGQVNLVIREPLDSKSLVLSVVGKERLKWETTRTSHQGNQAVETTTTHNQKLELFSSELALAQPQHYEPGSYTIPFQCALPMHLPPSISFKKGQVNDMKHFHASVDYKLGISLPVHGMLRADLGSKHAIVVKPVINVVPRSAKAERSQNIELMGLFNLGWCDFTARLRSDVLRIGDVADVRCSVDNMSKKRVSKVTTLLYQDITVTPLEGDGGKREYTSTVHKKTHPGFAPNTSGEARICPEMKANTFLGEMLPTHSGNLFQIGYRMRVKCSYTLCQSSKVEFPMTIIG